MYGNYMNSFNQQSNLDRINNQIAELEKIRANLQQPVQPITQNFQLAPTATIKYAHNIDEVLKTSVVVDTPFFSQDMSVLWVKNASGDVKSYELKEIIKKDEKDLQIEFLKAKIDELEKGMKSNAKSNDDDVDEPNQGKGPTNVSNGRTSKAKSKQSD